MTLFCLDRIGISTRCQRSIDRSLGGYALKLCSGGSQRIGSWNSAHDDSNEAVIARLAVQIARTQVPDYAGPFVPKRYTQPSLQAGSACKEYLHLDYRSAEALLASAQELQEALWLYAVPNHSTLWWFSR